MIGARNNPYWTGSYDPAARRFHPDRREPRFVDLGLYYCVNPHLVDDRGPDGAPRRLLHGWVLGARSPVDTVPYWIGAHSIPRVLELADDELLQSPVPEIETLRGPVQRQRDLAVVPGHVGLPGTRRRRCPGTGVDRRSAANRRAPVRCRSALVERRPGRTDLVRAGRESNRRRPPAGPGAGLRQRRRQPAARPAGGGGETAGATGHSSGRERLTVSQVALPCASSWTAPSWRYTAAARR